MNAPTISTTPAPSSSAAAAAASPKSGRIMIVDDEKVNIMIVRRYLEVAGYSDFVVTTDATAAMAMMREQRPHVVLLDIMMPQVSGLDILRALRSDAELAHVPALILTASTDERTKVEALELGATDFLPKPVSPSDLVPRVRNALVVRSYQEDLERKVRLRTTELEESRLQVVHSLARAAEFRDDDTGRHVMRVGRYAGIIARAMDLPAARIEMLEAAALLHDVGKIGIPDSILLKPGRLDPEEFKAMQQHCEFGKLIIQPMPGQEPRARRLRAQLGGAADLAACQPSLLEIAAEIAMTHHERWDGKGYPRGLHGEQIPLEGRITTVADVFDAVSSKRPYKPAFPVERCLTIIREGRGTQFDPSVVEAMLRRLPQILEVQETLADAA
jgi:putative two-component system response regulator